jgi:hypothetical protein
VADIDRTDFEFLTTMSTMLDHGSQLARAYLANSSPETRRANVADLARETVTAHTEIMDRIQGWLEDVEPPSSEREGESARMF